MYRLEYNDICKLNDYNSEKCENNRVRVFGQGIVNVKPDAAQVVIGVVTENLELEAAQGDNARITSQVINSIWGLGILPQYIQTQNYNIRPNYDYVNGKQVFRDYEVTNSLNILIRNINSVGEVIDTAVKNGANLVSGVNFIVSDAKRYYNEALRLALEDAQNKVRVIANKLNVNMDFIPIKISEQGRENIIPLTAMAFKSTNGTTPIEAGENKITAEIEAVFVYD
ncbi:SIMPL domain-containing protein [Clostridium saccharobutylicum]|uniref:26 kDa periplasmic immunogenic protein n=1 Tax=Clostridium saccharobutylicum DSM 13864 TaxID=1345695 RepID=U5MSE4_CLOSA|nr:SIMPL domain-containing protein [Clostridium saccharobutylicum]AGX43520.1 hypothetical protein CLSA_c25470 [Clostridium saccharobutylicum DSM 13864]AQR90815.1 26 kDa periplasmic immunogenic protein precursor [Clostridium saccharobutylicum]AQS00719.1 26 kDa periplasmic immunogenic protein precursor [Clostridium saccharobutylicum]AQS10380.1 26 kDa periplasmic immunogenic protein precursor [Clostridium saccharobutylicum]AQS14702.1 26 kDa periplasmic immunogenic protein precursor [Clostridium s